MIKQINIKCHIVYGEVKKRNEENKENKKNQQQQQKHLNYRPSEWLNTSDKCYILILIICVYLRCVYAYTADNRCRRRTRAEIVEANDILLSGIFASRWWVTWTRVRAHLLACIIVWLCTDRITTEIFLLTTLNSLSSNDFFYFPPISSKQMNVNKKWVHVAIERSCASCLFSHNLSNNHGIDNKKKT